MESKLPLIRRKPTLSDGNCWYDAIVDQMDLLGIPGNGVDHTRLRAEVCKAIPSFPQASDWIKDLFENSERNFKKFLSKHSRPGIWTDDKGIMCQATSLYLGRNIHVVGTINAGHPENFTKVGCPGADAFPPLYVGYYQDKHYQSLQLVGKKQQQDNLQSHNKISSKNRTLPGSVQQTIGQQLCGEAAEPLYSKKRKHDFADINIDDEGNIALSDDEENDKDFDVNDCVEEEFSPPPKKFKIKDIISLNTIKEKTNANGKFNCEVENCLQEFSRQRDAKRHMNTVKHPTRQMLKAEKDLLKKKSISLIN